MSVRRALRALAGAPVDFRSHSAFGTALACCVKLLIS
jgi:hypothetical protein